MLLLLLLLLLYAQLQQKLPLKTITQEKNTQKWNAHKPKIT